VRKIFHKFKAWWQRTGATCFAKQVKCRPERCRLNLIDNQNIMMKIKGSRKLTAEKWLNLFEVRYIARTGNEKSWQMASRLNEPKCITGGFHRPDAVVIVPFHTVRNKMVIIREYRVTLADYEYGFPAGLVDNGEGRVGR
jgi:hypothetical protein